MEEIIITYLPIVLTAIVSGIASGIIKALSKKVSELSEETKKVTDERNGEVERLKDILSTTISRIENFGCELETLKYSTEDVKRVCEKEVEEAQQLHKATKQLLKEIKDVNKSINEKLS